MTDYTRFYGLLFLVVACGASRLDHVRREASQCYQCNSVSSNDQCTGIQQCPDGDYGGCQTEVRTDGGGTMRITKKCKALEVCMSEEQQFKSQCTGHNVPQSICYYCCQDDLCNQYLPGEQPTSTTTTTTTTTTTKPPTTTTQPTTTTSTELPTTTSTTTEPPTTTTTEPPTTTATTTVTTEPPTTTTTTASSSTELPTTTTTESKLKPCFDPCASEPCLNYGVCLPDGDDFGCWCQNGYDGDLCEIPPESDTYDCDDRNPCDPSITSVYGFYYPHHEAEKYVQCDTWGGCFVMHCPAGQVWDQAAMTCTSQQDGLRALERLLQEIDNIHA